MLRKKLIQAIQFYHTRIMPKIFHLRGANFIARNLEASAYSIAPEYNTTINGHRFSISEDIPEDVVKSIISGNYEREEYYLVEKYLSPTEDCIELGAGLGYISTLIDSKLKNTQHVVLEPNPELIPILKKNQSLNSCNFSILEGAYSSSQSRVDLELGENFLSSSAYYQKKRDSIEASAYSLESIIGNYNIKEFSLVVDIEGMEYELINNEISLLKDKCRSIIIEFHEMETEDYDNGLNVLEESGFILEEKLGAVHVFSNDLSG